MSNEADRPTDPASLRPVEGEGHSVVIPKLRPLSTELEQAFRALPAPNPDNYVDMAIAMLLKNLERGAATDATADARHSEMRKNFDLTNHSVRDLSASLARLSVAVSDQTEASISLRADISELKHDVKTMVPRVNSAEAGLERLREEMARFRAATDQRFSQLESDFRTLRENNVTSSNRPATSNPNPDGS